MTVDCHYGAGHSKDRRGVFRAAVASGKASEHWVKALVALDVLTARSRLPTNNANAFSDWLHLPRLRWLETGVAVCSFSLGLFLSNQGHPSILSLPLVKDEGSTLVPQESFSGSHSARGAQTIIQPQTIWPNLSHKGSWFLFSANDGQDQHGRRLIPTTTDIT